MKKREKNLRKKGNTTYQEFKKFIAKGNVMDLAVGVIIGAAFGKIVTSVVNDLLMPILGVVIGGLDFTSLKITIGDATIRYGVLIQNIIDFLIVSICIFILIKMISKFTKKEEKEEEPIKVDPQEKLLEEIRDLLKEMKES